MWLLWCSRSSALPVLLSLYTPYTVPVLILYCPYDCLYIFLILTFVLSSFCAHAEAILPSFSHFTDLILSHYCTCTCSGSSWHCTVLLLSYYSHTDLILSLFCPRAVPILPSFCPPYSPYSVTILTQLYSYTNHIIDLFYPCTITILTLYYPWSVAIIRDGLMRGHCLWTPSAWKPHDNLALGTVGYCFSKGYVSVCIRVIRIFICVCHVNWDAAAAWPELLPPIWHPYGCRSPNTVWIPGPLPTRMSDCERQLYLCCCFITDMGNFLHDDALTTCASSCLCGQTWPLCRGMLKYAHVNKVQQ